jgi:hypothetical protein
MILNIYLAKNFKAANYSATIEAREKTINNYNPYNLRIFRIYFWLNLRPIKFIILNLATDF